MRAIFAAYDAGEISNFELNDRYVYSYEQPSHHVWCYDAAIVGSRCSRTLGYRDVQPIDPRHMGAGVLEGRSRIALADAESAVVPASSVASSAPVDVDPGAAEATPVAVDEVLLNRIRKLRAEVDALRAAAKADTAAEWRVAALGPRGHSRIPSRRSTRAGFRRVAVRPPAAIGRAARAPAAARREPSAAPGALQRRIGAGRA